MTALIVTGRRRPQQRNGLQQSGRRGLNLVLVLVLILEALTVAQRGCTVIDRTTCSQRVQRAVHDDHFDLVGAGA